MKGKRKDKLPGYVKTTAKQRREQAALQGRHVVSLNRCLFTIPMDDKKGGVASGILRRMRQAHTQDDARPV